LAGVSLGSDVVSGSDTPLAKHKNDPGPQTEALVLDLAGSRLLQANEDES